MSEQELKEGPYLKPVRETYRHMICGRLTTMSIKLAETYAIDPKFYSHTYCVGCQRHVPVADCRWYPDGEIVGS